MAPDGDRVGASRTPQQRRTLVLLAIGAAAGLSFAALGLLRTDGSRHGSASGAPSGRLTADMMASVNGTPIRRNDYERLLAGLERDSRNPIDDEARRHVLDRMIDEELLVQRGLEIGLAQLDRRVRGDLTASLIASVVGGADGIEPTAAELRRFYEEEKTYFTRPGRYRVRQIFFRLPSRTNEDANDDKEGAVLARAVAAGDALARGDSWNEVRGRFGDDSIASLPDGLLPATKLREYLGPTVLARVVQLGVGEVSEPIRSGIGIHLIELLETRGADTPALAAIESNVRVEWKRRSGDRALRQYLDELRANSEVLIQPALAR